MGPTIMAYAVAVAFCITVVLAVGWAEKMILTSRRRRPAQPAIVTPARGSVMPPRYIAAPEIARWLVESRLPGESPAATFNRAIILAPIPIPRGSFRDIFHILTEINHGLVLAEELYRADDADKAASESEVALIPEWLRK